MVQVAAIAELTEDELDTPHEVVMEIHGPGERLLARAQGGFQIPRPPLLEDGETQLVPMPFDFRMAIFYEYGRHCLHANLDSATSGDGGDVRKYFWVLHPEEVALAQSLRG